MVPLKGAAGRSRAGPVRFRYLFLLATVCGGCFFMLSISNSNTFLFLSNEVPSPTFDTRQPIIIASDEYFTINTEGCTIPGLKPYDESINRFTHRRPHPRPCPNANTSLLEHNSTHIWIETDNLQYYDVPKGVNIRCCYKSFYRPTIVDIASMSVDNRVEYEPCVEFSSYIEVLNEFVSVSCSYEDTILYEQFFLFAPKKPISSLDENYSDTLQNRTSYNVIVMGIDAISRLNFYRTMPKTLAYLKEKGAVELLGYNKVGDNTFPNLTPMLLGIKETDLKRTCWPTMRSFFDNCPFVWELYKEAGFYTALGEDSAKLGTFNYGKLGFIGTPTDYYIHTFLNEAENKVGNNKDFNSFICMGNKHFYKVLLDYVELLTETLKLSRLFGFFWEVTLSHDYLNYPMLMDDSYEAFLKRLENSKYLDETIFILLSDHGIRWGDIRYTKQGRLEERLPFVYMLVPPSFKANYSLAYKNLRLNSGRLTTPYDIHATLLDLINLDNIKNLKIHLRSKESFAHDRSISLFLPVPKNRTCKIAGIEDHWCTCHKSIKLASDSIVAHEVSTELLKILNSMLRNHPQCSRLILVDIIEATEMLVGTPQEDEKGWREIMVVIRTLPGGGVFEGTLRNNSQDWTLVGSVSRLNLYGDQSLCVHDYQLKLYCYCL